MENTTDLANQVNAIEKRYAILLKKRDALPRQRPRNGSKVQIEQEIANEAYFILQEVNHLPYSRTVYVAQLDDMRVGCSKMISNPYKW